MTKTRTTAKATRKKTPRAESRYQTVRKLRKTGETLADRAAAYKARYVEKPVKSGKALIDDLTENPRKTIETLADDSRELLTDLRKDARRKVDGYLKDGRKFYRRARKNPRKLFDSAVEESRSFVEDLGSETGDRVKGLLQDGRELVDDLGKDGRLVADRLQSAGKEALEKLSGRGRAGKDRPLLIKKYVNGRFYDTVNKKYLKKDDLAGLVKTQAGIRIISTKTGRNITRAVVSDLAVESQDGKKAFLALDDLANWLKKNGKRIQATVDQEVKTFREAMNTPA